MNIRKITYKDYINNKHNLYEQISQLLYNIEDIDENKEICKKVVSNMGNFINDGSAIIYGVFEKEIIKGFIWGYLLKNDFQTAHINYFNIQKDSRRKGYGTQLLNKLEIELTKKNVKKINLYVKKYNTSGIEFYKKNRFKPLNEDNEKILLEKEIQKGQEK